MALFWGGCSFTLRLLSAFLLYLHHNQLHPTPHSTTVTTGLPVCCDVLILVTCSHGGTDTEPILLTLLCVLLGSATLVKWVSSAVCCISPAFCPAVACCCCPTWLALCPASTLTRHGEACLPDGLTLSCWLALITDPTGCCRLCIWSLVTWILSGSNY